VSAYQKKEKRDDSLYKKGDRAEYSVLLSRKTPRSRRREEIRGAEGEGNILSVKEKGGWDDTPGAEHRERLSLGGTTMMGSPQRHVRAWIYKKKEFVSWTFRGV